MSRAYKKLQQENKKKFKCILLIIRDTICVYFGPISAKQMCNQV